MTTTSDLSTWQSHNDAYLAAALEWLRVRMIRRLGPPSPVVVAEDERRAPRTPAAAQAPKSAWWALRRPAPPPMPPQAPMTRALPPAPAEADSEDDRQAAARLRAAEASDPPPALIILMRRLGLSNVERDLLLLCVAMELDTRIAGYCAALQDDVTKPYPTFALALSLFDDPAWEALSPERPLRHWRLIEIAQPAGVPLTQSALRADERIVNFVKGLSHLDDRVTPFVTPLAPDAGALQLSPLVIGRILREMEGDHGHLRPIQLLGADSDSKQLVARGLAEVLGVTLYRLAVEMLPPNVADLETLLRLWERESQLLPVGLFVDAHDVDKSNEVQSAALRRLLARAAGVILVDVREAWPVATGTHLIDVARPSGVEQKALWSSALGDAGAAQRLAGQFNLSAPQIARISEQSRIGADPWTESANATRMRIDTLAQRIDAKATWNDIVVPEHELALLHQIAAHVAGRSRVYDDWGFRARMNRGLGISALFAGDSGTGKTMAAEVIANELQLSLHRIDLSAVVSKWVGETEKNIDRLFTAAEDGGGILFFDEADALFGKRTEVQHSQDRFANIEINFLLQRMESYRGLVILATNMKSALDKAFLRRLNYIVNFPFPGPAERKAIWTKVFPRETPVEPLDFDRLAKLGLAGGSVHNVALTSAILAAHRNASVTMPIVLEAARAELRKLERPVNEADFRWETPS
jgi:AAA+ superfamily predicted ATPase